MESILVPICMFIVVCIVICTIGVTLHSIKFLIEDFIFNRKSRAREKKVRNGVRFNLVETRIDKLINKG